jgi:hypothetical protein
VSYSANDGGIFLTKTKEIKEERKKERNEKMGRE